MRKLLVITAIACCFQPDASFAQERRKTFFQRAAEFFVPRQRAPQPAAQLQLAAPAMANNPANAAAKAERQQRLECHARAMQSWINHVCSLNPQQREKLESIAAEGVKRSQATWARQPNQNWQNGNRDFIPFEFVIAARTLGRHATFRRELKALLSTEQSTKLEAAQAQRDAQIRDELVGLAMVVLDRELFLNPQQRGPVAEEVRQMFGQKLYPGLYSFNNNSWPFQRAQFQRRTKMKELIGEQRYARYERLTKQNGQAEQYVMITMNNGDGETAFRKAIDEQPDRLAEAMAVRILFLAETEGLSEADCKKLTLAAKGAASRVIDKWIESSEKQMESMRERFANQNVSWGMSLPQVAQVESNKLWTVTSAKVREPKQPAEQQEAEPAESPEEKKKRQARELFGSVLRNVLPQQAKPNPKQNKPLTEREKFQRSAMIGYLVAMLDQEVWLRADQRDALRKLIDRSVGEYSRYSQYSNYYLELQMLADVLYVVPDREIRELLDEHQLAAWNAVKEQFQVQPNNNMVKLTYRYGDVQFPFVAGRGRRR